MKDTLKDTMKDTMGVTKRMGETKDSMLSSKRKTIGSSIMDKTAKTAEAKEPERKFRIEKRTLFF